MEIPSNDIYSQEFFFYAYSVLNKDKKILSIRMKDILI